MNSGGRTIVLAASDSESSEYRLSCWRQMLLATLPAKYARYIGPDWSVKNELAPDGQAKYVPQGLRIVESILLKRFPPEAIAVCYPDELDLFIGESTRVIGIHAHNPLGVSFTSDAYAYLYAGVAEPINAHEFRRLILHPAIRRHKSHVKIIVGGPGAWQVEHKQLQDEWMIDCLVDGEAEEVVLPLFEAAIRGESLPRKVRGSSPSLENIPLTHHRATFGGVEITRGCGRGCQFCSIALRRGRSIPLDNILHNVRVQVAEGADTVMLTSEDLFLYEQGPRFETNLPALKRLFESVCAVEGVKHLILTHATIAPIVRQPQVIEELSPIAVSRSVHQHNASTHPDKRYADVLIGIETGSPRLCKQIMKGKAYPFRAEQWPDIVLKGIEILNKNNWFPFCTFIIGLPGEREEDTRLSLDLLHALRAAKWCVVPTLFLPMHDTKAAAQPGAKLFNFTDLQWEFFFTCWRYNLDFFRDTSLGQWKWNIGVPFYYYLLGRKLFGPAIKYPLFRLGHIPERFLRRRLYLDLSGKAKPKLCWPGTVEIPTEWATSSFPIINE
jgi:radical SAM superfamily enzyme YgiQ (UPF0313 family)